MTKMHLTYGKINTCFKMILHGVFFCVLKSTNYSTNVYIIDNCLTALLQDFAIHLVLKRSWLSVQIACHPFYFTPLSAQHPYHSLVERHQTVHQDTWIPPVAQPPADTDPDQVFHPYFVLFIHAGSSWSLPLSVLCLELYITQPLCNPLREAVNTQERYHTHYKQRWALPSSGSRICASLLSCCCSIVTPEPPMMHAFTCRILAKLVLKLMSKWKRSLVTKSMEGHIQNQTISSLFMALPTCLPWS